MHSIHDMFSHHDSLRGLSENRPLPEKLTLIHQIVRDRAPFVCRVAVAIYDRETDLLKTFIHSTDGESPLTLYHVKLSETGSLKEIVERGRPRVINNLNMFADTGRTHTRRVLAGGFGSSYTLPLFANGEFFGFLFFNAYEQDVFQPEILKDLDLFGHLISLLVSAELASLRTLLASVKTASDLTHARDFETGYHLDRMANYAWIIARQVAPLYGLSDEEVQRIFIFAPLHDIGKIAIPDAILKKPGKLTGEEYAIMKTHALKGREIIDAMLDNFGIGGLQHIDMLRNIANYHHEALDGSGYHGLKGADIPVEARVIAVADVFDALTSKRPYKDAWSNDEALAFLTKMSGDTFDAACVQALIDCRSEVEEIQHRFAEDPLG